ncbi:spore germination lipoprotein GerD [Domibacillus robiginosus]|uniref:spore germination lipoprotein GerD n=1 Tax=Domibacillus robiginosus TaxID=1071054 RepID=UPI00067C6EB5|nr:spore germination lipoprotein GerD [Domibacillus robiginosus]
MRNIALFRMLLLSVVIALAAGCANQNESPHQLDYEETKKMVVDILKTDDGKKALQEAMTDKEMREDLIMNQNDVTEAVQSTLTSEKGKEFWQKAFEDPKFVESYAKSMEKEHKKLLTELMKDPDYQKMLLDVMKDPEMQKTMQTAIKSQEFRKYLQGVIEETLASPLYKAKMEEAVKKAAEEASKKEQSGES